ncbi:MAG: histidine kinase [Oscillatoria sp. PMC 1068.18]|nr:histidine kinase [Oscillatoria sp. PMC 1076.18]MEC4990875.1 histidine kinase [Oscillatoria sp. PMC 1068.18]
MQKSNGRQTALEQNSHTSSVLLRLLLFIDERPSSEEHLNRVRSYLDSLQAEYPFELKVIDVGKQPYLAEHFRLVATPALVKICPEPKQTLAGTNLVAQLQKWWSRWQLNVEQAKERQALDELSGSTKTDSLGYSEELIRLSEEIFQLKKEKEELQEQLNFKDRVLAMLVHDLRSPLTAASIAVDTIKIVQNQPHERFRALTSQLHQQACNQFRIMERMISDILEASKGKSAELKIEPHQLYLQNLCQEILAEYQERFDRKSQTLQSDLPPDIPAVYADQELVRQVVINLLENAIKYTPEGGEIQVSILHRTTQKIQVSIRDTGPGIPEEKRERIFERHFRLQRDEAKEGYGLGLSLCHQVIRSHYGQIWVDTGSTGGSCFHFTLPVYN